MPQKLRWLCVVMVLSCAAWQSGVVRTVWAAPADTNAPPPSLDRVKKLFREGRALFVKRAFAASLEPLQNSFQMLEQLIKQAKDPNKIKEYLGYRKAFLATLAIAYHWNRQYVDAYKFYVRCVAAKPSQKLVQLCQNNLPKVLRFLARLEIETVPAKAQLELDWRKGKKTNLPSPLRQWVSPGDLDVKIRAKGCVSLRRRLTLQPGTRAKFLFQLRKPAICPSGKPALVKVVPAERVMLGSLGMTPSVAAGAPPAPQSVPQPFAGSPWPAWKIGLVVGGAVAGAALIGLGAYGIAVAVNNRDQFVIR